MYDNRQYFATLPPAELAAQVLEKVEAYNDYLLASGRAALWNRSYDFYYRGVLTGGALQSGGEHGEFTLMNVNHYKSLLTNIGTMTASNRPAYDPRAINTDTESIAQAKLAAGLLDYYLREKKVERYLKESLKHGLLFGEGFLTVEWNVTGGEEYGVNPETGATIKEGDLAFESMTPHFVARDINKLNSQDHSWYILTRFVNKFDLAAKYPDLAEKILDINADLKSYSKLKIDKTLYNCESDDIPVFTFYHRPTDSVKNGRMVEVLSSDLVTFDGPLPYRNIPVYRLAPENEDFSIFGYTIGYDLMSLQETLNNLYSVVATNNATFGVQNIMVPTGFNINPIALTGGLNLIEFDPKLGKPEALQLTLSAPEIHNFIEKLERAMETISAVNSVARGNPEASLKSGSALALVQQMAIQFNSNLQQSYLQLNEDVGTGMINILKDFAEVPRVAMISGKNNRSYMKKFSGQDLKQVSRVVVDSANALSKTLAGKTQLAENLLQGGLIKDARQYITVIETGNLDPMVEDDQFEMYQVRDENEMMVAGEDVYALITDEHKYHIQKHKAVLSSPEARKDPKIVEAVINHIQAHVELLKTADPQFLQMLGQEPLASQPPQPQGQPMPEGSGSTPAVNGMPQPGPEAAPMDIQAANPQTQEVAKVNMPNMPTNPLTGEQAPKVA